MTYEIVRDLEGWARIRREWNRLLANSGSNRIFLTYEWLDCWLQSFSVPPALLILCIRDEDGNLIGAAPFYRKEYVLFGRIRYSVLHMIGDSNCGAEYQSWIAHRTQERVVYDEMARILRAHPKEWDLIWMPHLDSWSENIEPVVDALRSGGLGVNCRDSEFATVLLPDDYDAYLGRMSSNRRQQVRRMTRKILTSETVEVRRITTQEELAPALDALFELHNKRWQTLGMAGVFERNPAERDFYLRFAPLALQNGWLALFVLSDGGVPKAVQIGYIYEGTFLQLQEGFDPDYSPHVGNALRAEVIQVCIKEGIEEYDFLGGMSEHKRRWLAEERTGMDLLAGRPSLGCFPIMKGGVWPTGRYLQPSRAHGQSG